MWKKFWLRFALRQLSSTFLLDYKLIDKQALEEWAYRSFDDRGFRSYFAHEDLKILKALGQGPERDQAMVFVGRRLQLMYLFDEMRQAMENKKSREEKKAAEAKVNNNQP